MYVAYPLRLKAGRGYGAEGKEEYRQGFNFLTDFLTDRQVLHKHQEPFSVGSSQLDLNFSQFLHLHQ